MAVPEEEEEEAVAAPLLEIELVALDMGLHFVEVLQAAPSDQVARRATLFSTYVNSTTSVCSISFTRPSMFAGGRAVSL